MIVTDDGLGKPTIAVASYVLYYIQVKPEFVTWFRLEKFTIFTSFTSGLLKRMGVMGSLTLREKKCIKCQNSKGILSLSMFLYSSSVVEMNIVITATISKHN
jgi:hypothetical protein